MKTGKKTTLIIAALLLVTAAAAVLHLTTRTDVSEGVLLVEQNGIKIKINLEDMETAAVSGTIVNGKGEEKTVDGMGIALGQLLAGAGVTVPEGVTVVAEDEYSAFVTADELSEPGRVFLLIEEGARPRLAVFGDADSKRNVTGVVRLVVE